MRYVIIGNGVASIGAIEGIRANDPDGEILIVSEEAFPTYGRPLISYYLADKVAERHLPLRPESFYTDHKVGMKLQSKVTAIDPVAQTLTTEHGESIAYDRLLLAMGGAAYLPAIAGLSGPGVFTFTQRGDVDALRTAVKQARRVVVVGAGLIALKAAEALAIMGKEVTLAVRSRLMRSYFDEHASDLLKRHLERKGLAFAQGHSPQAVLRDENGVLIALETDKGQLPADVVIMAAGVRPQTDLAKATGIDVGLGIQVDDHMRTSALHIFAAGDCVEAAEMLSGSPVVMPIWPNAFNQGYNAGANMAGADLKYPGSLNMNSISYWGLPTTSVGLVNPPADQGYDVHVESDPDRFAYRKLVFKDDRLVGCILLQDVDMAGFYTGFIRFRITLDAKAKEALLQGKPSPLDWPESLIEAELKYGGAYAAGELVA